MSNESAPEYLKHKDNRHVQVRLDYMLIYLSESKAKIIRILETWTDTKYADSFKGTADSKEQKSEPPAEDLWITMSYDQFSLFVYGTIQRDTIKQQVDELVALKHIERRVNPAYPYGPPQYRLNRELVQKSLDELEMPANLFDLVPTFVSPKKKHTPQEKYPQGRGNKPRGDQGKIPPGTGETSHPSNNLSKNTKKHTENEGTYRAGESEQSAASGYAVATPTHAPLSSQFVFQIQGAERFYYHDFCIHEQDRGINDGLTLLVKRLSDIPQDAECSICYKPIHGPHGYYELPALEDEPYQPDYNADQKRIRIASDTTTEREQNGDSTLGSDYRAAHHKRGNAVTAVVAPQTDSPVGGQGHGGGTTADAVSADHLSAGSSQQVTHGMTAPASRPGPGNSAAVRVVDAPPVGAQESVGGQQDGGYRTVEQATLLAAPEDSKPARARASKPTSSEEKKPEPLSMPPDDAKWNTTTCLRLFDFWRGAPLLAKHQLMEASHCAKGMAANYTRKQVEMARRWMVERDPYWSQKPSIVDVCTVAGHIHEILADIERSRPAKNSTTTSTATVSGLKRWAPPAATIQ